jgi:hypothetical protein
VSSPALALSADALAPIRSTLAAMSAITARRRAAGLEAAPDLSGLASPLVVTDAAGWTHGAALARGAALDDLLDTAKQRWGATPHAAAALAFKCYSYWVALPAVLGYAAARRVPLVRASHVVARWAPRAPFVTVGLLPNVGVAVLPNDPLALLSASARRRHRITVVPDETALIGALRTALVDQHLGRVIDQVRARLHVGRRTLLGSLASGVAHGLSRAADAIPGPIIDTARDLLIGLGVDDLVDLAERDDGQPGLTVQRRTCCLAFTLPEPRICTGCCIR